MKTELLVYICVVLVEGPFLTKEIESIKCSRKMEGTKKKGKK